MPFLSSFLQYAVTFVILAAIGVCGAFLGVRFRKRKNARLAEEADIQKMDDETKEASAEEQ